MAMTRQKVLDQYFMDARHKLIDIAAFLDRVDRAEGDADFRLDAFRNAMKRLDDKGKDRAQDVLMAFSDPTEEPISVAHGKGAWSALWRPTLGVTSSQGYRATTFDLPPFG